MKLKHQAFVLLSFFLFLLSCQPATDQSPKNVLVINIRGASYTHVKAYVERAPKGFLAKMLKEGHISALKPVTNAVTATNWASFETGVNPGRHGIIGHQFGSWRQNKLSMASGFGQRFEVPSFLETADSAGKKVVNIGSLLLHGAHTTHQQLKNIAQGQALTSPRWLPLDQEPIEFEVYNGQVIYIAPADNGYLIDLDKDSKNGNLGLIQHGEWLEVPLDSLNGLQTATRLKLMRSNGKEGLFIRSVFVNRGYPSSFLQNLEAQHGAATGWPSLGQYFSGLIDAETIQEEIETEIDYLLGIVHQQLSLHEEDLIVTDYPLIDRYGHIFGLHMADSLAQQAFARLDADLEDLTETAQGQGYKVLIQSGHGFAALHSQFNLNKLIKEEFGADSGILAIPGKVSAQLYLSPDTQPELLNSLKQWLMSLKDPETDDIIVDQVWGKPAQVAAGIDHSNAGDLFVLLKPGYVFTATPNSSAPVFSKPLFKGDHGYSAHHPGNEGVLIHPGFKTQGNSGSILDLAPTILDYLKIQAVHDLDGKSLLSR